MGVLIARRARFLYCLEISSDCLIKLERDGKEDRCPSACTSPDEPGQIVVQCCHIDSVLFAKLFHFGDLFLGQTHLDVAIDLKNLGPSIDLDDEIRSSLVDESLDKESGEDLHRNYLQSVESIGDVRWWWAKHELIRD